QPGLRPGVTAVTAAGRGCARPTQARKRRRARARARTRPRRGAARAPPAAPGASQPLQCRPCPASESRMQADHVRAVVTGGVSGLGLAVARRIVADGGKVALLDVNDDKGVAAVEALGAGNARYFRAD